MQLKAMFSLFFLQSLFNIFAEPGKYDAVEVLAVVKVLRVVALSDSLTTPVRTTDFRLNNGIARSFELPLLLSTGSHCWCPKAVFWCWKFGNIASILIELKTYGLLRMKFGVLPKILTTIGLALFLTGCGSSGSDGGSSVVVSYGDNIITIADGLQYQLPLVVQVSDSDGAPQANATVNIELTTTLYFKGQYAWDSIGDQWVKVSDYFCSAEDTNDNGALDIALGEDVNGNGILDPKKPTITSHPSLAPTLIGGTPTLVTDNNGFGYFTLSYPKTEASWVTVRLAASVAGALPENRDIQEFRLFVSLADVNQAEPAPAFRVSPYGIDPNCAFNF